MAESLLLAAGSATAGTTAASIAGSSLFAALPSIGTVLSAGSAIGSIMGGSQQNAIYKAQAQQSELAARQEELKGRAQADQIRRSLQSTLASQNAAFGARGISLNSGTPLAISKDSRTQAALDIETAQFGAGQSAAAMRSQAAQSRIEGSAAKTAGYVNAATSIFKGGSLIR